MLNNSEHLSTSLPFGDLSTLTLVSYRRVSADILGMESLGAVSEIQGPGSGALSSSLCSSLLSVSGWSLGPYMMFSRKSLWLLCLIYSIWLFKKLKSKAWWIVYITENNVSETETLKCFLLSPLSPPLSPSTPPLALCVHAHDCWTCLKMAHSFPLNQGSCHKVITCAACLC